MKDINTLSGIEFENLCQVLLQKAGFDVETTKASGDGGIDLIARCHQPFFDGKYIIQCKRYAGGVGEPIIRDLYGVVMAEHANKGILMTTGYFSMSAINFSHNKNLELIDGEKLAELLSAHGLVDNNQVPQKHHFTQYDCFNLQKYDFYKKMINQGTCTIEMGRDFLFSFMFDYFVNNDYIDSTDIKLMIHSGFAEEYLRLFDWYAGKYYKRGKDKLAALEWYKQKYKNIAYLYNFDFYEYVQSKYSVLTYEYDSFDIEYRFDDDCGRNGQVVYRYFYPEDNWDDEKEIKNYILDNFSNPLRVKLRSSDDYFELMNLLSLFRYFGIDQGVEYINKKLYGKYPDLKGFVESQKEYQDTMHRVFIYYVHKHNAGRRLYELQYCDMTAYFDLFKEVDSIKIIDQIKQIKAMLAGL